MRNERLSVSTIVSCDWLYSNLDNEYLVVLDASIKKVTENSASTSEWIPNTRFFDLKGKFSDNDAEFPNTVPTEEQFQKEARCLGINNDSVIIIYDDKGIYSSPRAWWLFKTFGHNNVAVLDGGLPEWKASKHKTVKKLDSQTWDSGNFTANYQTGKIHDFQQILEIVKDKSCIIFDARSEERFKGLIPEPRVGLRSGTIPNSVNLPFKNLLKGNCLRSKSELKAIFNTFEIGKSALTFSCGSGITACILALAAEISGFKNLSIYDGSWTEYGSLTT